MRVLHVRNVTEALPQGIQLLLDEGVEEGSRAGPVLVHPEPVATVYRCPWECVLTSPVRDANPFFHLGEALWMLRGRRDATFLDRWVRDFSARFAEPGGVQHGAYGYRWWSHFNVDQIGTIVGRLRRDPRDRRVVLAMWDPREDLFPNVPEREPRDVPCNTHVYFRLRDGVLDMTVCCRSNDAIWGAYGANAVHFAFLQAFVAAQLGAGVGEYTQVSNNFHVYNSELERMEARKGAVGLMDALYCPTYDDCDPVPLMSDVVQFKLGIALVVEWLERGMTGDVETQEPFLAETAVPAFIAHACWRAGDPEEASKSAQRIAAPDWRRACVEWLERRQR